MAPADRYCGPLGLLGILLARMRKGTGLSLNGVSRESMRVIFADFFWVLNSRVLNIMFDEVGSKSVPLATSLRF